MEELLNSEQFSRYRQLILEISADYISSRLFNNTSDIREIKGALDLMKHIIRLPYKIRPCDFTKQMVIEDLRRFEINFIRNGLQPGLEYDEPARRS